MRQERALRRAVGGTAVWATAEEMSPSGGERTGQVAMVISEVFGHAALAGRGMLMESAASGDSRTVGSAQ